MLQVSKNEVAFKAANNGKWVSAEHRGERALAPVADEVGEFETFELVIKNYETIKGRKGMKVSLKCKGNGKFVAAEFTKNSILFADRDEAYDWEEFLILEL